MNTRFENLLNNIEQNQYIGIGNPNSKILFIGKEAGIDSSLKNYHGSLESWKNNEDYSKSFIPSEKDLRDLRHTWQKYQKLYENILLGLGLDSVKTKVDKYEINFVEKIFTTELSNLHAKTSKKAVNIDNFSTELKRRKDTFFKSDFIKQFPIIVIFASAGKYIETYQGEVCELFDVKFNFQIDVNKIDKIWVHSEKENSNNRKLLLHTRQLTNGASLKLIEELSSLIVKFIKENSLTFDQ